ncbi:MAG: branched-chain amino acid ABC transporter permease [Promethearchaeota archaeon]|nr:MAG: branched-chain amino acid ABC transporter permease [Candidatus Lokiarchaeota archaeon]
MSKIKDLFQRSELVDKPLSRLKYWLKQFKGSLTVLCLIGLFSFPLLTQNPYYLGIFINASIFSIFAASWNFLAGFTGQVSFGHAIFLGMGGYFTSALIRYLSIPWFASLLVGGLVSILMALLIGIITLRLKGPYLALATMALGIFLMALFNNEILGIATNWLFFGSQGIDRVPPISGNSVVIFYTYLTIMLVSVIIMILFGKSNFGTVLKSIRDDDTGAEASGINITKYKVMAFMISGFFAGLAGGLFSMHTRNVAPAFFQPLYSFYAIIMTTIGGLGVISGSVLGAFVFFGLEWLLSDLWDPVFLFSIILIVIIRFAEEGLLRPILENLKDLWDILIGK